MSSEIIKTHEIPIGPKRVMAEIKDFIKAYRMSGADWGCCFQLFFDSLSAILGALFTIQNMATFGVPIDDLNSTIWARIVPGIGLSLLLGNLYYPWMAIRLTNRYGRPYTAQPYGINTPSAFAFVYNVMYPVYFQKKTSMSPSDAFFVAYKAALAVNFITGLIGTILSFFGPYILKYVPPSALLVPIAGIGMAFLGLEQATYPIAAPIVGYYCIMFVFLGWYANVRMNLGFCRMPQALQVILSGTILGWSTGLNTVAQLEDAAKLVKWYGPTWTLDFLIDGFGLVGEFFGLMIPIAIASTATTLMCLVSAQRAGDPYPVTESMVVDGIGTMLCSVFGSPFGTVIYIGHPAYKRSGALVGYTITFGIFIFILSLFGILAAVQGLVNRATIGPIVLFVGMMVNEEALAFMPPRHYSAYVIGLFPSIYDWVVNISNRAPMQDPTTGGNENDVGSTSWYGVLAWKRGSLLISMIWVGMIVMIMDRRYKNAVIYAMIGAAFSAVGVIHVPAAGFKSFTSPTWEQCTAYPEDCWEFGEQWMYMTAYLMMAATFILIEISRATGFDKELLPPIIDATDDAFQDWFKHADKLIVSKTMSIQGLDSVVLGSVIEGEYTDDDESVNEDVSKTVKGLDEEEGNDGSSVGVEEPVAKEEEQPAPTNSVLNSIKSI